MSLTIFLFKVSHLEIEDTINDIFNENQEATTQLIVNDMAVLFCAKVIFRGLYFKYFLLNKINNDNTTNNKVSLIRNVLSLYYK